MMEPRSAARPAQVVDLKGMRIIEMLARAKRERAMDLNLYPGTRSSTRVDKRRLWLEEQLSQDELAHFVQRNASEQQLARLEEFGGFDCAIFDPSFGRVRMNVKKAQGAQGEMGVLHLTFRFHRDSPMLLSELRVPDSIADLAHVDKGFVPITAPPDNGKNTLLDAWLNEMNMTVHRKIVGVGDPLETIHENRESEFSFREVGERGCSTLYEGVRSWKREAWDVGVVVELVGLDSIQAALYAASSGTVYTTLQTTETEEAISWMVEQFDPAEQSQVKASLVQALYAVVGVRLLPRCDGPGLAMATELLMVTPQVRLMIREGRMHQIRDEIVTGTQSGMHTLESSLARLVADGIVAEADARHEAVHKKSFEGELKMAREGLR